MTSTKPTISELAFLNYCESRSYIARAIPLDGSSTPDVEVIANGSRFVAEIKEFTANPHDEEQAREIVTRGSSGGIFDGRRVRRAIEEAAPQLRTFRDQQIPTIVVLYDNIIVNGVRPYARCPYFDPTQIEWGNVRATCRGVSRTISGPTDRNGRSPWWQSGTNQSQPYLHFRNSCLG